MTMKLAKKLYKQEVDDVTLAEDVEPVEKRENQNIIAAVKDIQRNVNARAEDAVLVVDKLLNSNNYYTC